MSQDECRMYDVDGQPVVVRGGARLTERDQAALAELVRAVRARGIDPDMAARQDESRERNRARLRRLGLLSDDA